MRSHAAARRPIDQSPIAHSGDAAELIELERVNLEHFLEVQELPKIELGAGTALDTKDENPNRRWGFQWRRRELNPGPRGVQSAFVHVRSRITQPTGFD